MWKYIFYFLMFIVISCGNEPDSDETIDCSSNSDCPQSYNCYFNKCYSQDAFISTWFLTTSDNTIQLPLIESGTYDFEIDWGDGTVEKITNANYQQKHAYRYKSTGGKFNIIINGVIEGWQFYKLDDSNYYDTSEAKKIIEIVQWGSLAFGDTENQFWVCKNLQITATDAPDLSKTTSLKGAFAQCEDINPTGLMFSNWDVSNITNMSRMFSNIEHFNQDLSRWDVSNVTDMSWMFSETHFNQDISSWDVSKVTNMEGLFIRSDFNQDISSWDVSNVTDMSGMFQGATFNQDISGWNVSNVEDMSGMFFGTEFNQDISGWDVSKVTDMSNMFYENTDFNQDISGWDVSSVTNMSKMFYENTDFNQDISGWNVSNVEDMSGMFFGTEFNQDISGWDVSKVTDMSLMFCISEFNHDISSWDVSKVTDMSGMFQGATFNQDISGWDVSKVTNMDLMFKGSSLSTSNYDSLLIGWSDLNLQKDVYFGVGSTIKYSSAAEDSRNKIIDDFNWTITDGGLFEESFFNSGSNKW